MPSKVPIPQTLPYFCATEDFCEVLPSLFTKLRLQTCPVSGRNLLLKDGSQDQKHQRCLHLIRPRDERQEQNRGITPCKEHSPWTPTLIPASSLIRFLTGLRVRRCGLTSGVSTYLLDLIVITWKMRFFAVLKVYNFETRDILLLLLFVVVVEQVT